MKKIAYMAIGAVFTLVVSFSYLAFANTATNDEAAVITAELLSVNETKEEIKVTELNKEKIYPLGTSIWVYRNDEGAKLKDLVKGDKVELIFNSKNQVTYIKARAKDFSTKEITAVKDKTSEKEVVMNQTLNPSAQSLKDEIQADEETQEIEDVINGVDGNELKKASESFNNPQHFELKIEGKNFEIKMEQNGEDAEVKIEVDDEDKEIKLEGIPAKEFIKRVLTSTEINSEEDLNSLASNLASKLGINTNATKVEVKLESNGKELKFEIKKGKGKDKSNNGKGKDEKEDD